MMMIVFSLIGLLVNGLCLYLLTRHRHDDINLYSTWLCARNDIIGNVSVMITALLVFIFNSRWPDIIIGLILASVLFKSAVKIVAKSKDSPQ